MGVFVCYRDTDVDSVFEESNTSDTSTVILNDSCNESDDSISECTLLEKSTIISVMSDSCEVSMSVILQYIQYNLDNTQETLMWNSSNELFT